MTTPTPFNTEQFNRQLRTSWLGRPVVYLPSTSSTNDWASQYPARKLEHGTLVITDNQTHGKGQYQRHWQADEARNITCSVVLHPGRTQGIHLLTMTVALSCLNTLQDYTGLEGAIKWPNDIILDNKKIGGILTETAFLGSKLKSIIIGLGLNVNQHEFPGSYETTPTSLAASAGQKTLDRTEILAKWCFNFERHINRWEAFDDAQPKEVNDRMLGFGEWVTISIDGEPGNGSYKVIGIDQNGSLCLLNEDLEFVTFTHEQIRIHRN